VKRSLLFRFMMFFGLLLVASGYRVHAATPQQEIGAIYSRITRGIEQGDTQPYLNVLAPNAVLRTHDGKRMSREMLVQSMSVLSQNMSDMRIRVRVVKFSVKGSKAVAVARTQFSGSIMDRQGNPHPYTSDSTSRDTWVKTKTGWKIVSSIGLTHNATLDGRPYKRPA
jgi:ketosteroid isomerase-like protein